MAVPSETRDPSIGEVFEGRYRLDARLGRGGMGAVYRAHQLAVGRDVAVKVLHPSLSADAQTVARFENEAQVIAALRHPNTLKLLDVGRLPDDRVFIVTELVEGETLDARLARGLTLDEGVAILTQVCDALSEAHAQHVVHRDLKPANVMVERIGTQDVAKVLDFGIAKLAAQPKVTATGTIFGTPAYMSPEQAQGTEVDARTDIYALGVMLYQLASGRLPFESESPGAMMVKHMTEEPPPPSERMAGVQVPPRLEDLILQLLEKDPNDRPQSMGEVRRRIADPALLEVPRDAPTERAAPPTAPDTRALQRAAMPRRVGPWLALFAAGLLLVGGWVLQQQQQQPEAQAIEAPSLPPMAPAGASPAENPSAPAEAPAPETIASPAAAATTGRDVSVDTPPPRPEKRRPRPRRTRPERTQPKPAATREAEPIQEPEPVSPPPTPVPPGLQDVDF